VLIKPQRISFEENSIAGTYSDQICDQLCRDIKPAKSVDLRLSIVKPLGAQWIICLYDYFKSKPDIAKNGFKEAGITFIKKLIE